MHAFGTATGFAKDISVGATDSVEISSAGMLDVLAGQMKLDSANAIDVTAAESLVVQAEQTALITEHATYLGAESLSQ